MIKCNDKQAWHDGSCCCNCTHQVKICKHPLNEGCGKGRMSEQMGYVCLGSRAIGANVGIFSDRKHGCCELYNRKID